MNFTRSTSPEQVARPAAAPASAQRKARASRPAGAPDELPDAAPREHDPNHLFDVIVIGSGFGGAFAAHPLVRAGLDVLMIERGEWVERGPAAWEDENALEHSPHWFRETEYRVRDGRRGRTIGSCACVGGASVFYGGVSLRFRERDFDPAPEIVAGSGAAWPFDYRTLEPYYACAERLLDVSGEAGADPTEPPRGGPYPQPPAPLSRTSHRIEEAARALGLCPFRLPLAIRYEPADGRPGCLACPRCDMFACGIGAKNDLASTVLPVLARAGLRIRTGEVARRLLLEGARVTGVECVERGTGRVRVYRARHFVLAAGALASPHLLLASDLQSCNPAGELVGRFLMRHCSAIAFGVFTRPAEPDRFHKQLGLTDFYFGDPGGPGDPAGSGDRGGPADPGAAAEWGDGQTPAGKLGSLQQLQVPPLGLVQRELPAPFRPLVGPLVRRAAGLLAIAEDRPSAENRVTLERGSSDLFGLPRLAIVHRYAPRDLAAREALLARAGRILRRAGARYVYVHRIHTYSHAVGTVRMGEDPETAPLDPEGRFRGVGNLRVADGSVFPTSAGVNPSLTIAACALRIGESLAREG